MKWPMVPLEGVATIIMGQSPPSSTYNYDGQGLPFFQGKADFGDLFPSARVWCDKPQKVAEKSDILISVRAPVGPTNLAPSQCCVGRGLAAIRGNSSLLNSYVLYFLRYIEPQLALRGQGSTFSAIGRSELSGLKIPLPPISEQQRIVEILDQADALRRKRAEADARAARILPALFYQMFGDPATNPMGWPVVTLGDLGKVTTGNTPSRKVAEYYGDGIEWVKPDNLVLDYVATEAVERLTIKGKAKGRTVAAGSTLVTCIAGSPGSIGNAAVADREVAFNQQINAVTPIQSVDPHFLYGLIFCLKKQIQAASTGGMVGIVNKTKFEAITAIRPPGDSQRDFGCKFRGLLDVLRGQQATTEKVDSLFQSLLHSAFAGD